jgi:hypothetical protein
MAPSRRERGICGREDATERARVKLFAATPRASSHPRIWNFLW